MNKKKVLIFGATTEIALFFSRHFLSSGYELLLSSNDQARLQARGLELEKDFLPGRITLLRLDLSDRAETEHFLSNLEKEWSEIEIICLSMGLNETTLADITDPEIIDKISQINFLSPTRIISRAINAWIKDGSKKKIFYTSSVAAARPLNHFIYASSKIATEYFIRGLKMRSEFKFVQFYIFRIGQINNSPQSILGKITTSTSSNVSKKILHRLSGKGGFFYIPNLSLLICSILSLFSDKVLSYLKEFLQAEK